MKYDINKIHKLFTIREVRELIAEEYDGKRNGSSIARSLLIHKSLCAHGIPGCLFFALNGSPPKGYALYVPEHNFLLIIDAFGKSTRHSNCILVDAVGKYVDIGVLPDFQEVF